MARGLRGRCGRWAVHGTSSRGQKSASCRRTVCALARVGIDSLAVAHGVEGLYLRVPDVVVEFEQAREYVREARSPALLGVCRRHVVRRHLKTQAFG
jgi:hypothetical protein